MRGTLSGLLDAASLSRTRSDDAIQVQAVKVEATDNELLRTMLAFSRAQFEEEGRRTKTIDTKATTLISALGVMGVFIVNAAGLLLNSRIEPSTHLVWALLLGLIYVITAICFLVALTYALRAAGVYAWSRSHPELIKDMDGVDLAGALRMEIESLTVAWQYNSGRNNLLADLLRASQDYVGKAAVGLVALAAVLTLLWLFRSAPT
jgi:hypothetical protein